MLQREGGQIGFPETRLTMKVHNSELAAVAIETVPDVVGMLFYANHDLLLAMLDKKLVAAAADSRALNPEQKQKHIGQAAEALFTAELDEATLTLAAWQDGLPVEANDKLQPAAWLAVRNVVPAPAVPPETSAAHAYSIIGPR